MNHCLSSSRIIVICLDVGVVDMVANLYLFVPPIPVVMILYLDIKKKLGVLLKSTAVGM